MDRMEIDDSSDATAMLEQRLRDMVCNSVVAGTRDSYASKARNWAAFCARRRKNPFPVDGQELMLMMTLLNSPDTAAGYVSALAKCSRLINAPFNVDWRKINDIVNAMKRLAGPKRKVCAILAGVLFKILDSKSLKDEERMMIAMVYCYLLRLGHEGVELCR
jgi:hypothetical protein